MKSYALIILVYAAPLQAADCAKHPIFCQMEALQPKVDAAWGMEMSNAILRHTRGTDIEPSLVVAIMFQESSLRKVHTFYPGVDFVDIGVAQINSRTALRYGCDLLLLLGHDPDETAECQVKILKDKMAVCRNRQEPWACYHSFTPALAEGYAGKVRAHLGDMP